MGGVSPETCWASYKYEIKFWYTVASFWIFLCNVTVKYRHTAPLQYVSLVSVFPGERLLAFITRTTQNVRYVSWFLLPELHRTYGTCLGFYYPNYTERTVRVLVFITRTTQNVRYVPLNTTFLGRCLCGKNLYWISKKMNPTFVTKRRARNLYMAPHTEQLFGN